MHDDQNIGFFPRAADVRDIVGVFVVSCLVLPNSREPNAAWIVMGAVLQVVGGFSFGKEPLRAASKVLTGVGAALCCQGLGEKP